MPNCRATLPYNLLDKLNTLLVIDTFTTLEENIIDNIECEQFSKLSDRLFVSKSLGSVRPKFLELYNKYMLVSRDLKRHIYDKWCISIESSILEFEDIRDSLVGHFNESDKVDAFHIGKLKEKINKRIENGLKKAAIMDSIGIERVSEAIKALEVVENGRVILGYDVKNKKFIINICTLKPCYGDFFAWVKP